MLLLLLLLYLPSHAVFTIIFSIQSCEPRMSAACLTLANPIVNGSSNKYHVTLLRVRVKPQLLKMLMTDDFLLLKILTIRRERGKLGE